MKVVINKCYGGFSLSPKAIKRLAELQGKECYFFNYDLESKAYAPLTIEGAENVGLFWTAFSVPNPAEIENPWETALLDTRENDRANPLLIQVVEELGKAASGQCAELAIIEIPDGVEYTVEEYDGYEHIAEKHRTWG